jgi:nucleotide-binding universal stress UspA family protein
MPAIQRILAPVDFSERALGVLPYVRMFAIRYGAEVILLHVVNPVLTIPATGPLAPMPFPVPEFTITEANEKLEEFGVDQLAGIPVRRLSYEGEPLDQIVACARSEDVQLITMPTHGYGRLGRFLFGSITEEVRHELNCPVFTAIHMERGVGNHPETFERICVTAADEAAEAWAADLATDFGTRTKAIGADELNTLTSADLLVIGRDADEDLIRHVPCPVVSV